jgi:DNA polymerase III epsilon subunit family exonuclease
MHDALLTANLGNQEFTALDLETTGLSPIESDIIEIAAIRFNREKILGTYQTLVKPIKNLFNQAVGVNGITQEMLKTGEELKPSLEVLIRFLEDSILVIQNSEFDLSFLVEKTKDSNIKFPTLPVFCTVQMTRKYFPNLEKYNLTSLRRQFNISKMDAEPSQRMNFHEALDDSYAAMKVFLECMKMKGNWEKRFEEVVFHNKNLKFTSDY